jgi:hypothetical protein
LQGPEGLEGPGEINVTGPQDHWGWVSKIRKDSSGLSRTAELELTCHSRDHFFSTDSVHQVLVSGQHGSTLTTQAGRATMSGWMPFASTTGIVCVLVPFV